MGHVGDIDRDHRPHLGAAIAFIELDAELRLEGGEQRLAQLLGADHDHGQGRESRSPRRRADSLGRRSASHQDGRPVARHQLPDRLGVERIGVVDGADPEDQRNPQRAGEAEEWKKGSTPITRPGGARPQHPPIAGMQAIITCASSRQGQS